MSHRPYKPTQIMRLTLTQEVRVVLEPELGAPAGSYRQVQVMIPASPKVYLALDVDPKTLGLNRNYKLPVAPPGAFLSFTLLPEQFVVMCADIGLSISSVIVQHLGGE